MLFLYVLLIIFVNGKEDSHGHSHHELEDEISEFNIKMGILDTSINDLEGFVALYFNETRLIRSDINTFELNMDTHFITLDNELDGGIATINGNVDGVEDDLGSEINNKFSESSNNINAKFSSLTVDLGNKFTDSTQNINDKFSILSGKMSDMHGVMRGDIANVLSELQRSIIELVNAINDGNDQLEYSFSKKFDDFSAARTDGSSMNVLGKEVNVDNKFITIKINRKDLYIIAIIGIGFNIIFIMMSVILCMRCCNQSQSSKYKAVKFDDDSETN